MSRAIVGAARSTNAATERLNKLVRELSGDPQARLGELHRAEKGARTGAGGIRGTKGQGAEEEKDHVVFE